MTHQNTHTLLSSLGVGAPITTLYTLGGQTIASEYSSIALLQLLPPSKRPTQLLLALTPEAIKKHSNRIVEQSEQLGVACRFIEIAGNELPDDSAVFLERVAREIPEDSQVTLDVTQGLRHHAFLFYALALYLSQCRGIDVLGAWYCRWEISRDDSVPRPFIDLMPTLDLTQWFHALAVFNATGSLRPISKLATANPASLELGKKLDELSTFFLNGSPIEAGRTASQAVQTLAGTTLAPIPLHQEIETQLANRLHQLAGQDFAGDSKKSVQLDQTELERQTCYIDHYFQTGQLNLAFGLLREWIVNWIAIQRSETDEWLQRRCREKIEHGLGGLVQVFTAKDPEDEKRKRYLHQSIRDTLNESQRGWAKRWNRVCDIRNSLQHHGMKSAIFDVDRADVRKAEQDWRDRRNWQPPPKFGGGQGRLLICPIGLTPGVLFSAASHVQPDRILVIASEQSAVFVEEALSQANCGAEKHVLLMENIHTGINEFDRLVAESAPSLFEADEIHANFTGGTSLMGALVHRLVARGRREYQRAVREFVLIDKRLPQEQRDQPWELGNVYYLDGQPASLQIDDSGPSETGDSG